MRIALLPLCVAFLLSLLAAPSSAVPPTEKAEILYSRGLVEFHAGRYQEALGLFEKAVAANPDDVYARYYRGVTRGRLGDYAGAVDDLQYAVEKKPEFDEAALELGVALVETERYEEAVPLLEQAQRNPHLEAQASLFLGLAELRLGRDDEARENFERAAARDPELRIPARYYEGVAAYRAGRWREAEEHFAAVVDDRPESDLGREAQRFLDAAEARKEQTYEVYAGLGFEYDSNVPLVTQDENLAAAVGDQDDGRVTLSAGGRYTLWSHPNFSLAATYDFFQSLHFDLTDFDLQNHRAALQLAGRAGDFRFGTVGRYDYYLLDFDSFLNEATAFPWAAYILPADIGRTEVYYRFRYRGFQQNRFEFRDAFNHAPGARQVVQIDGPDRYVFVGYQFDTEDPTTSDPVNAFGTVVTPDAFAYDGQEVNVGVGWAFPYGFGAAASYAYRYERYDSESEELDRTLVSERRIDNEHHINVVLTKDLTSYLRMQLAYYGTINDSNKDLFQYDRHIGSVSLEARY